MTAELSRMPGVMFWTSPLKLIQAGSEVAALAARYLWAPLAYVVLIGLVRVRPFSSGTNWSSRLLGFGLASALPTAHAYLTLVEYPEFAGYPPFVALFALFWLYLSFTSFAVGLDRGGGRLGFALRWGPGTLGIVGGVVVCVANYQFWRNTYPTLHNSMFEVSAALVGAGFVHLLPRAGHLLHPRTWRRATLSLAVASCVLVAIQPTGFTDRVRPYVGVRTLLGKTYAIAHPIAGELPAEAVVEDEEAEQRLRAAFSVDALPRDFEVRRHNILLVVSEATRYDATSLADPTLGTTPNLVRLKDLGAYSFESAIAPSSVTLDSMSSLLTMRFPSSCELETWNQLWKGELKPDNVTVTERLAAVGYHTFWAGHNYRTAMTRTILGLGQGFEVTRLLPIDPSDTESEHARTTDHRIANAAIDAIDASLELRKPFFGLVFFASPHRPYLERDTTRGDDPLALYLGEVEYMDAQFGRVLDHVRDRGLLENTIVVFLSDHGEEFGEHGGRRHGRTLYVESVHVPFLIRFPGVEGETVAKPVSTAYLFPWVFLHDDGELREAAMEELRSRVGPMLRETDSAVVSELFGNDRMLGSLTYSDRRIHYDFMTGLYEVFDTTQDPAETRDLMLYEPARGDAHVPLADRYRVLRASMRRATVIPDKTHATRVDLAEHRLGGRGRPKNKGGAG